MRTPCAEYASAADRGETCHPVLGGDVGRGARAADQPQDRRHVDDGAAAGGQDGRDLRAHGMLHTREVDIDDTLPFLGREFARGLEFPGDAGIVESQVQSAEMLECALHRCIGVAGFGRIARVCHSATAGGDNGLRHALRSLEIDIGDHDLHAICGQQVCRCLADARTGAADQRAIAFEGVFHSEVSFLGVW